MLLPVVLTNLTLLTRNFENVALNIRGPVAILHDSSDLTTISSLVPVLMKSLPVMLYTIQFPLFENNSQKVKTLILLGKNLVHIMVALRSWNQWTARHPVLVLTNSSSKVQTWLERLWRRTRSIYVTIMVLSSNPTFYTWYPYRFQECTSVLTITRINETDLFPIKKLNNLNQCPITVSYTPMWPIVINNTHGQETQILQDLAKRLNATVVDQPLENNEVVWSVVNFEGDPVSGFKKLSDNDVDLIFSYMHGDARTEPFVDVLISHTEDYMTYFVPGPMPLSRAIGLYKVFNLRMWLCILVTSNIMLLATIVFYWPDSKSFGTMFTFQTCINLNLGTGPLPNRQLRILSIVAYFYSLHICTWYMSSFVVFLANPPREDPIETLEALAASDLKIWYHETQRGLTTRFDQRDLHKLTSPDRAIYSAVIDVFASRERHEAILGHRTIFSLYLISEKFYHLNYDEYGYPKSMVLKERILTTPISFFISKGHPLREILNKYTRSLIEAGLPHHYLEVIGGSSRPVVKKNWDAKPFQWQHIEGAIYCWIIGIFFVSLCFMAELLVYYIFRKDIHNKFFRKSNKRQN